MAFHIVLVEPEIPGNTGNISRTCAGTGTWLHLVKPLGFTIDDAHLKRAGLDYWNSVKLEIHDSFAQLAEKYRDSRFFFATTKAARTYAECSFQDGDFLVFGKETAGLPDSILTSQPIEQWIRIPMSNEVRSLNLSNSASIVLYEALRQTNFPHLR